MDGTTEQPSQANERHAPLKGMVLTTAEGRLLLAGIAGILLYIVWMGIHLVIAPDVFQALIGLTATEVVFGRVACMAFGYSLGLHHGMVILVCMILETILVLIFYPLLVFIWRQLLVLRWLKRFSDHTRTAAETNKDTVEKYGIIGLFTFVWLPFWMTGPVVGCMIGYMLGLRVRVNITTVLAGTYVAILGWAYLLHQLYQKTMSFSSYAIMALAAIASAAALVFAFRKHISRKNSDKKRTF